MGVRQSIEALLVCASLIALVSAGTGAVADAGTTTVNTVGFEGANVEAERDGSTADLAAASCYEIKVNNPAAPDGVYWLQTPQLEAPAQFFCDQTTDGGGWVSIAKGREGWQPYYGGQGDPKELLIRNRTASNFDTVQLPAETVDGLLGGGDVKDLGAGIRLIRARNVSGTQWQTVRFGMPSRDRWVWAFGAEHPTGTIYFGSSGPYSGGTTKEFGADSAWMYVGTAHSSSQGWNGGWAYGTRASGGSTSSTSFIYSATGRAGLPYTEMYIRPTLMSADLDYDPIDANGTPAESQISMVSSFAARTPWGVTGNLNGRTAEGNSPVQAFEEIGGTIYVGGNFTTVQRGKSASGSNLIGRTALAAFDRDSGELITSFHPVFNDQVKDMAALPNGKLLVVGDFTEVNGNEALGTVLLDPVTGQTDTSWNLSIKNALSSGTLSVRSASVSGDYVYLGGSFTHLTGGGAVNVYGRHGARVAWKNSKPDRSFNPEFNGTVVDGEASSDGTRWYAAGYFSTTQTGKSARAAAIQTVSGNPLVTEWQTTWSADYRSNYQQAIHEDGDRVYVGGSEHSLFGFDRESFQRKSGSITLATGGDFQALTSNNGVIYGGCHCTNWNYQDTYVWPDATGWTQADKIQWVGARNAATGEYIPSFSPPKLGSDNAGAWALFVDSQGSLWAGGDFNASQLTATTRQWNGGFVKFPENDSTAPDTPTSFKKTSATDTAVNLTWNNVQEAATYEILRDDRVIATTSDLTYSVPLGGEDRYFVRAVDSAGNRSASSPVLKVSTENTAPVAEFSVEADYLDVTFTSNSTDSDGSISSTTWDFGDGTYGKTGETVTHTYAVEGTYTVTLTVVDDQGGTSEAKQKVTVQKDPDTTLEPVSVIDRDSEWSYYYDADAPDGGWKDVAFDASGWQKGKGAIGYGSSGITTNLNPSPIAAERPRAAYFRNTFEIVDPSQVSQLTLNAMADDGVVIYVNGTEVGRCRIADGDVTHSTFANGSIRAAKAESDLLTIEVPANLLVAGTNTITAETHVNYRSTADVTFWLTADLTAVK